MKIRNIRISCWIPKSANTHSIFVIVIAFSTATIVAQTLLSYILTYITSHFSSRITVFICFMFEGGYFKYFSLAFLCFPFNRSFGCSVSTLTVKYGTELQRSVTTHIYLNSFLFLTCQRLIVR
jgi:hypothetical protein